MLMLSKRLSLEMAEGVDSKDMKEATDFIKSVPGAVTPSGVTK